MMKMRKQLLIVILLITAILVGSMPAFAIPEKTVQQKADALNAIKIITGTNGEYNLASQLKRSEAITYMIRLIGKADYVVRNKDIYSTTAYSDVASTQWYAPYVGYASEYGFVSKASTQFKPNDTITDKDFIRLILIALDYREGVDFATDTALDKAWEIGLINVTFYVAHANKSVITTRATAVELLHTALALKLRAGDKLLCHKLVDEGAATRKQLSSLGFLEDKTVTQITQVNTLDLNKLEVKFNENIAFITSVRVYEKSNPGIVLGCNVQSLAGNTLTLLTSVIDTTKEYIVELTEVQDEEENSVNLVQKSFKGFETKEIASNFFKISKVEATNDRSIKVYFTHPVSLNSEVCLYYSIIKDNTVVADGKQGVIKAGIMNSGSNAVVLSLNSGILNPGALYTLQIEGNMMSAYGAKMNNGLGDSMKFIVGSSDDANFELKQITAVDKKTLLLSFNKEVNSFLAEQIYNFYLTDENNNPIKISTTAMNTNRDGVYLNLGQDLNKDKKYWLTINNLNDVSRQEYITEQKFDFLANYGTVADFIVNGINVPDNRTIELSFNRPLNEITALNAAYYTLTGGSLYGIHPEKVIYNPAVDPNKVKLHLSKYNLLNGQNIYNVRVESGMKDNLGNNVSVTGINFTGTSTQRANTAIRSVVPVSTDSIKVTFTEEITFNLSNLAPSNFALEYTFNKISIKKVPVSVIYVDAKTVILRFDALDYNTGYTVKVIEMLDFIGNTVKGLQQNFKLEAEK